MDDRLKRQLKISFDRKLLASTKPTNPGDENPSVLEVQKYLQRFGYMPVSDEMQTGKFDDPTISAVAEYQRKFGVDETGILDADTIAMMAQPRCGIPDNLHLLFNTIGPWHRHTLTYAFGAATGQAVGVAASQAAVRAAFRTWEAVGVGIEFAEIRQNQAPDILVEWRRANDPDLDMRGTTLAHADFPPDYSIITNRLPLPIHFDDTEHTWRVGNRFDIETVALHEIGHILGLLHEPNVSAAVMFPNYSGVRRALNADDVAGLRALYPSTYARYDLGDERTDSGYPRPINSAWRGMTFTDRVDAALNYNFGPRPGKAYFFRGDEYIRYDLRSQRADSGYPRRISSAWNGISFTDRVDAAFKYDFGPRRGKAYFFRDDQYIRYDLNRQAADAGYPRPISSAWEGMSFTDRVDAVFKYDFGRRRGKAYFFRGDQYIRYDLAAQRADPGYPRSISSAWRGLRYTNRVGCVFNYELSPHSGKAYFFS